MSASSKNPNACSERLKALADPTRLGIVEALMEGPLRVAALGQRLRVEQSLLSHHLKTLREVGFVTAEREGKGIRYRLAGKSSRRGSRKDIDLGCCHLSFETRRDPG